MEFTYETARLELTAWRHVLARIDLALCRKGGHPDEAAWIVDRPLHDSLTAVSEAIHGAVRILQIKEDIQSYRALGEKEAGKAAPEAGAAKKGKRKPKRWS